MLVLATLSFKGIFDWGSVDHVPINDGRDPSDTDKKGNGMEEPDDKASAYFGAHKGMNEGAKGSEDVQNEDLKTKVWLNRVDIFKVTPSMAVVIHFALNIFYIYKL